MAKSYITKFVEYVKDCKNQLKNNLITKGQEASDTETLDSLISKVTNINLDTTMPDSSLDYVRDPNLPDVDAMFDTDPLRAVNGGEYAYCQYLVCFFPTKGSHDVKFAPYWAYVNSCNRIDFSDGTYYDSNNTPSSGTVKTVTIGDNGIYTLENGSEVFIAKIYSSASKDKLIVQSENFSKYAIENIVDRVSSTSSYSIYSTYCEYARLMNTNGVLVSASTATTSIPNIHIIIDGDCAPFFESNNNWDYTIPNIKINGCLSTTSTSMTIGYPSASSSNRPTSMPVCKYLKIPDKTADSPLDTVKIGLIYLEGLYIPDWVKTISHYSNKSATQIVYTKFKKLHIGNGLITPSYFTGSGSDATYFYNVTDLTLSPNAFSQNTDAITLHFDSMINLTDESIANLVTNLADRTGKTTNTIRLPIIISYRMTEEQITTLQNKNWTVTFV